MRRSHSLLILAPLTVTSCAYNAANQSELHDRASHELRLALECRREASPHDIVRWVEHLGGLKAVRTRLDAPAQENWRSAIFTLPNPVSVFGQSVQTVAVTPARNKYGEYLEYSSFVGEQRIETIAGFAGMSPDFNNVYHRRIGGRELTIRPESGQHYIVCANDVRSFAKSFHYWVHWIDHQINPEGVSVNPKSQNNPYRGITRVEEYQIERKPVKSPSFSFDPPQPDQ